MKIRSAARADAAGMGWVLRDIIAVTGRNRPNDTATVLARYIDYPDLIRCSVAVDDDGQVLGFQSLILAREPNAYAVPAGWGIIGTHISPRAHRQGVGSALFASTEQAARAAGLHKIDAYIGADNPGAQRYYEAMGFRTYREPDGIVQKVLTLE